MATIDLGTNITLPYKIGDYVEYYPEQQEKDTNSSIIEWDDNYNDSGNSGYSTHHYQMIPCPFCPTNTWNSTTRTEEINKNNESYWSHGYAAPNYGVFRYECTSNTYYDGDSQGLIPEEEYNPTNNYYRRHEYTYSNRYRYFMMNWSDGKAYGKTSKNYKNNAPETRDCPKCHRTYKIRPTYLGNLARGIVINIKLDYTSGDSNVKLQYLIQPCLNDGSKDISQEPIWLTFQQYKPQDAVMNQLGDWMGTPLRFDKHKNWNDTNNNTGPTVGLHMHSGKMLNDLRALGKTIDESNLANSLKTALDLPNANSSALNVTNPQDIILYAASSYIYTPTSENVYSKTGIPKVIYENINDEINLYNIKGIWIPEGGAE